MNIRLAAGAIVALLVCSNALAQLLTEKKFFTLPQYTTAAGKTIKNVRVGYETYGKLNAAGDNAVFVAHFFSGTSHAAGRYKADEKAAGYWDAIIGPGKAIDTDKYFVVSADTLANLNVKSPLVGTTGPATVNPDTGKPYGSSFPVVSMKDSVRVHKALVDSLGIKKLKAVAGASGGSIQAMEWGAEYPELVERVIHVIGPGLDIHPLRHRPARCLDDADQARPELEGRRLLRRRRAERGRGAVAEDSDAHRAALRLGGESARLQVGGGRQEPAGLDGQPVRHRGFALQVGRGARRARPTPAHFVWMAKANQLYNLEKEQTRIKAKVLFLPATTDMIFPPELSRKAAEKLKAQGNHVELYEIEGTSGHLDGLVLDRQSRRPHQGVPGQIIIRGQVRNSYRANARTELRT